MQMLGEQAFISFFWPNYSPRRQKKYNNIYQLKIELLRKSSYICITIIIHIKLILGNPKIKCRLSTQSSAFHV